MRQTVKLPIKMVDLSLKPENTEQYIYYISKVNEDQRFPTKYEWSVNVYSCRHHKIDSRQGHGRRSNTMMSV